MKPTFFDYRIICLALLCIHLFFPALPVLAAGPEPEPANKIKVKDSEQALSLIEVFTWSNTLPRELVNLQNEVEDTPNLERLQVRLPELAAEIEKLDWEITMAMSNPTLSFHQLSSLDSRLVKIKLRLDLLDKPIKNSVRRLETLYKDWLSKEDTLHRLKEELKKELEKNPELDYSIPTIESLEEVLDSGKILIQEKIRPILVAGREIGEIQTRVYTLNDTVADLVRETNELGIQQTSPSMFSSEFYERFDKPLVDNAYLNLRLFAGYQWTYLQQHRLLFFSSLILILLLSLVIHLSKSRVKASSKWYNFACKPLSTAIFIATSSLSIINTLPVNFKLPPQWETLLFLPMIIAVALLTENVCSTPWQSKLLKRLCLFLAFAQLLSAFNLPQPLIFLLVFYISILGLTFYLFLFWKRWQEKATRNVTWAIWLWGLFPLTIVACGISGHDQLAITFFYQILTIVVVTLMIWLMLLMLTGLLEMILLHFPLTFIRRNTASIVSQFFPVAVLLHALFWLVLTLMILRIYPSVDTAFNALTSTQLDFFTLTITPASVLTVVFTVYLTLLFSRAVRAFLLQEVLPRYGAEIGSQVSVTRLVHYAILTIGFFILLKLLGFGLSNLTILGGALGVGIGFGLQAIVNNFVSGLILLFEQPVKVGDMIAVGEEVGEVKELGLRATVVATFDNAEIVIPNSELITTSVTNWTLAEKRARVKVPVGVAYGSDIALVLKILLGCADVNPMVLTTPKPQALFLNFGASSLDFELRAWIPDFSDRLTVRSELNQDIEAEFQLAGIEIPFPQTDLHLRSVAGEAASALSGKEGSEKGRLGSEMASTEKYPEA